MIDFFDNMRFWGGKRNKFLSILKFYQFMNGISQLSANIVLPFYFLLTKKKWKLSKRPYKSERIIVSMTSFPARITKVHLVVEAMLRQTYAPDKIILYLTKSQIPSISKLPEKLLALQERGLEIILIEEDIRSHTKYYGAFRDYPNDIVITIDDDILYRSDLIENLLLWHKRFPKSIITNWAKKIQIDNTGLNLYKHWPEAGINDIGIEQKNYSIFGVGGVLYPPHSLYKDCLNCNLIRNLSLTADDIWLSAMAIIQGTTFVYTGYKQNHLPVTISNNITLLSEVISKVFNSAG